MNTLYKIWWDESVKVYIGMTINKLYNRKSTHLVAMRKKYAPRPLQNMYKQYSEPNFTVLAKYDDEETARLIEKTVIAAVPPHLSLNTHRKIN